MKGALALRAVKPDWKGVLACDSRLIKRTSAFTETAHSLTPILKKKVTRGKKAIFGAAKVCCQLCECGSVAGVKIKNSPRWQARWHQQLEIRICWKCTTPFPLCLLYLPIFSTHPLSFVASQWFVMLAGTRTEPSGEGVSPVTWQASPLAACQHPRTLVRIPHKSALRSRLGPSAQNKVIFDLWA